MAESKKSALVDPAELHERLRNLRNRFGEFRGRL
jgi:hypothetical protein